MNYEIIIEKRSIKSLKKIQLKDKEKIKNAINQLKNNQHPVNSLKIEGFNDIYRLKIGPYRVIYEIDGQNGLLYILAVDHRKHIYKKMAQFLLFYKLFDQ